MKNPWEYRDEGIAAYTAWRLGDFQVEYPENPYAAGTVEHDKWQEGFDKESDDNCA